MFVSVKWVVVNLVLSLLCSLLVRWWWVVLLVVSNWVESVVICVVDVLCFDVMLVRGEVVV